MTKPTHRLLASASSLACITVGLFSVLHAPLAHAQASEQQPQVLGELKVETAAEVGKQALGSSTITKEDIARIAPTNDISDIVRRQPGVNLTGNSASGQYGNNRQIDIRGMGPENTMIMIDGMPVLSRNAVRYGRSGERNTRGDSNWVPVEEIESIEVLRGPAAVRYGSGAAGGVVNIITKGPSDTWKGSASAYTEQPQQQDYSKTYRYNASVSGPIAKGLSFRLYGNYNVSTADAARLNAAASADQAAVANPAAGREGVQNKDINGLIRWQIAPGHRVDISSSYSRQGNRYAGEYALAGSGSTSAIVTSLSTAGAETNVMMRATGALNYKGDLSFGTAKLLAQYEDTINRRLNEGLVGGPEGTINTTTGYSSAYLRNWYVNGSLDMPFKLGGIQNMTTFGAEMRREYLNDPFSMTVTNTSGTVPGTNATSARSGEASQSIYALFIEDNMILSRLTLTPGLRMDFTNTFGNAASPSLNASWKLRDDLQIKGGVAYAFKAPNLYQLNPNYLYRTNGNGCPLAYPTQGGGCLIQGNADLNPERSLNTEMGLAYTPKGWNISATWFRNHYDNKIRAGNIPVGTSVGGTTWIFKWENAPNAIVEGFEGNIMVPLAKTVNWSTNGTVMTTNKIRATGEKLSVVPDYTINSTLNWQPTKKLDLTLIFTRYGKQTPNLVLYTGAAATAAQAMERPAYHIASASANFKVNRNFTFGLGMRNMFNKVLYRASANNGAGANNYNEAGRSFWVKVTAGF
ncbi:TonB-dependent receptor [Novosphingobium umbonatum]|uniref:TonB-dependent receptor n=1 Tax=Novosphingobium umbonatum TaxID=1908524 RepID=A0A3S2UNP8_9SPHN|nr:FepA family TonB-dependent siderophore receptor [Novosphingobium umbonatum]RVU02258.1 TonB-dependent receptor [Novosphingobium umbonatum]